MNGVVVDTNVFVAAGFTSKSAAARILAAVREGRFSTGLEQAESRCRDANCGV
jgi:hypothetical protein